MDFSKSSSHHVPIMVLALTSLLMLLPVFGQINTPCTPSMLTTLTPCMNFLTNGTGNVTTPSADCCNSLKNLTSGSMGCVCLVVTGSFPFQIPINRTLAVSLPRACNMPGGVPVQCQVATAAPIPTPAIGLISPISLAPTLSPGASPSLSPNGPIVPEPTPPAESPDSKTNPDLGSGAPTATTGSRPVNTPSAANPSYSFSPFLFVFTLGFVIFKY